MRDGRGWMVTALALATAPAWAQNAPPGAPRDVFELALAGPGAEAPMVFGDQQVHIIQAGEGFETRAPLKGAPYSADTVSETVQTLADGNRIVHRSTGSVARDSEGRTRREQSLGGLLPFGAESARRTIFIHDPAAGTSFSLEPDEKVARKMGRGPMVWTKEDGTTHGGPGGNTMVFRSIDRQRVKVKMTSPGKVMRKPVTEPLGTKVVEGVEATGTRTVATIPPGEIGNERAIETVNEQWVSTELKVVVMSRHSDPRFGETTYRLTGIQRSEPDRSLFEVPADYTVKEGPGPGLRIEKKISPPEDQ